ncbi:MAG: AAA family ATPase [Spirochaetaceae bacterium]|nr:AAA family ATPase [Spirochaetaceae bacterium]
MLERIELRNVGPAPEMALDLASRINLITGDNGLGKSFLLDVAWWALTRKWPRDLNPRLTSGYPARPTNVRDAATLGFTVTTTTGASIAYESTYSAMDEAWPGRPGRPYIPGLVVYAHADGGFSVWDPARNYWRKKGDVDVQERVPGYVFSPQEVWTGLNATISGNPVRVCRGLLDDWASWIREQGAYADVMTRVLGSLTVRGEPVDVGPNVRLSVDDAQDIPSIKTDYSDAVPIVYASAGIRRIAALAYVLVWSWTEHTRAAELLGSDTTNQIVLLFDEIEAHLHPLWQRTILPALLTAMSTLSDVEELSEQPIDVQLVAATHSPLVLASVEPLFEVEHDRLFHLDVHNGAVRLDEVPWAKQGDVVNWLVSETFGLRQGRSIEAERAIEAAEAFMRSDQDVLVEGLTTQSDIQRELERVLPGHDAFWPRWVVHSERGQT